MNRSAVLVLALLLAGCIDMSRSGDAADSGSEDVGTGSAGLRLPGALLDAGFEGLECASYTVNLRAPGAPAQQRAPEGFNVYGSQSLSTYYLFAYHCGSGLLGEGEFQEDVWILVLLVQGDPPDDHAGEFNGYALEAFTDWPLLVEAWADLGMAGGFAEFESMEAVAASGFRMDGPGVSYQVRPLANAGVKQEPSPTDYRLYAGDGTTVFDYVLGSLEKDFLPGPAALVAEGGFLSEVQPGADGITLSNGYGFTKMMIHN